MSVFFSPHSDIIFCLLSVAMLLAGSACLALSRESAIPRPAPSWRYLGLSLVLLAIREWFGILGISDRGMSGFYAYSAILLMAAAVPILLAARIESPPIGRRFRVLHLAMSIALVAILAALLEPFISIHAIDEPPTSFPTHLYAAKIFFFLSIVLLAYSTRKSRTPPSAQFMNILYVLCVYCLVMALCIPPGIPPSPELQDITMDRIMAGIFLARVALAFALAVMIWSLYARALGVVGPIRWWPPLFMFCFVILGLTFVHISIRNYQRVVMNNLTVSANNASRSIPGGALLAAAATPGSANHPQVANRVFGQVRELDFYTGYTHVKIDVDALAVDPENDSVTAIIDITRHPHGGLWALTPKPIRELWEEARERGILYQGVYGPSLHPALIVAPIAGDGGAAVGAAVLTLSSLDLAQDLYVFKRPALLCLPIAFLAFLLLVGSQQRAWLASHSTNRAEALKLGALGNDLTGVMITRGDVVIDVNKRLCDMVDIDAESMIGGDATKLFTLAHDDGGALAAEIHRSLSEQQFALFEIHLLRPNGKGVHLMVHARKLNNDPTDDHHIWESVDITRLKEMEHQIRDARDVLQLIVDSVPVAVFVKNPDDRYRMVNQRFAEILGKSSTADVVGHTCAELHPEAAETSRIHDEICLDMPGSALKYDHGAEVGGEKRFFEVLKTAKWLGDGESDYMIIGTMHDLTTRKKTEDAVKAERHFLMQLINALPVIVCFLDRNRVVRLCDLAFCREAGVEGPEELIGRPYDEIAPFGPADAREDLRILERGSGYSDIEFELSRDGRHRNFMLRRIAMSTADGQVQGLLLAFWDTTALVAANRAAKNADRARATFLSSMSHELRTPMNGIVGMADLIMEHDSAEPVQRLYAETIIKSAKTLQMVMDEVMDIATLDNDAKRLTIANAPFPLLALVEESAEIASCIVGAWGVDLMFGYDFSLSSAHVGDARRLRQILIQILTHCSRLAADRRLHLTVHSDGDDNDGRARISIHTHFLPVGGVGPADLEEMFKNPAQTADDGKRGSNLGVYNDRIGLPLAWRLIEAMGGELAVTRDGGAIRCAVSLALPRDLQAGAHIAAPDLGGMRVLVAVNDGGRREASMACLRYAGAFTEAAGDRHDIVRRLHEHQKDGTPIDLLLLDTHVIPPEILTDFIEELEGNEGLDKLSVVLIVSVRNFQNVSGMGDGLVKSFILPPILPSELWHKAKTIWQEDDPDGSKAAAAAIRTRSTTRITRNLKMRADVLLVEDNTVNQMVAMGILKRIGCNPVLARNGAEAVERVLSGEEYDIILMDCMMPVMDGYEATGQIRLHEKTRAGGKRHTIVALTASNIPGDMEKCLASGMDDYITKPITMELMRDAMIRHCPGLVREHFEEGAS